MTKPAHALPFLILVLSTSACGPKKPPQSADNSHADDNSGDDGKRSGAKPIEVNKVVTDEVNFDKGDMTDWKSVELKGRPGLLTVELHWDSAASNINVDVFDGFGTNVAASPDPVAPQLKKVSAQIDAPGSYFVRVTAPRPHEGSVYTLEAKWEGEAAPVVEEAAPEPPPPPVVEKEKPEHHHHEKAAPHKPHEKKWSGEGGVQGRVVSSYKEGAGTVLHIDKGSAAGVQAGQSGKILDGASGETAVEGGDFTITSVIDESKSIGKTSLKSLGHNLRVSINTGK